MKYTIKEIVQGRTAQFAYYRQKHLYYSIELDDGNYVFPIPIEDLMEASVNREERAITLMRYVRKALDEGSFVRYY